MKLRSALRVPDRIGSQIALLIIVSTLALHLCSLFIFSLERRYAGPKHGAEPAVILALIRILANEHSPGDRQRVLNEFNRAFPTADFVVTPVDPAAGAHDPATTSVLSDNSGETHRSSVVGVATVDGAKLDVVAVPLRDGLVLRSNLAPSYQALSSSWLVPALAVLAAVVTLGLWAARQLTRPLRAFAQAAEQFELGANAEPLPETGPQEVRSLARSLNGMRARITKLVEDRTHMLASVGHDLRTPITRLRLRTEFLEPDMRETMLRDLDHMTTMVDSALNFLRNEQAAGGGKISVDAASLVETVCDEFIDMGRTVTYDGPTHLFLPMRQAEIHRALANLIDNATTYGSRADVTLDLAGDTARIVVADDGPGIPPDAIEHMTQPFIRGDAARNLNKSTGFGLGLSVVRRVAEAHAGSLELVNRPGGGLAATIVLPKASTVAAPSKGG